MPNNGERKPLLPSSPTTRRISRLYSGELPEEERDNLNNELQEESEYREDSTEEYDVENSDTESLLPDVVISDLGTRLPHQRSFLSQFCSNHKKLIVCLLILLIITGNILAIYFVYFYNNVRLKVLAYNVWGMPAGIGGCQDKQVRIPALAESIKDEAVGANQDDFDLILFEELWMSADHQTIAENLPKGFHITGYRELASAWCDGNVLITTCSGLAIVSKYPFKEIEFNMYTYRGSIWDGEGLAGKGVGRVRIEPIPNLTVDVFVTHTIADSGTTMYNNTWVRINQVEELMNTYIDKSNADVVILGGDFNSGPTNHPGEPFQIIKSKGMINSVQEIFYKLDEWLHPRFATYANTRNTFSNMYNPIIYDYIFHRSNSRLTTSWTNWFDLPLFTTRILASKHNLNVSKFAEEDNYTSPADHETVMKDHEEESLVISLSDHEPVISTIYIKKWRNWWPYL
jgi:endonuclease/exonuclease/phosphatase family metal-dependent hydrolase